MITLPERNSPRWLIFLIDMGICLVSLGLAYVLRFDFLDTPTRYFADQWDQLKWTLPVFLAIRAASFFIGKTYQGIVRFTSTEDAKRLFITVFAGSVMIALVSPIRYYFFDDLYLLPRPIIIMDFLITLFLIITSRFVVKLLYLESRKKRSEKESVIIYGSGELGIILKRTLDRDQGKRKSVFAYIDDDPKKVGKRLEGIPIESTANLEKLLAKNDISSVIIGILKPDVEHKNQVIDICIDQGVETLSVPPVESWINGELNAGQIRKIRIEDLLGRKEIKLSKTKISSDLDGQKVLITGAAGSIGSEVVRQVLRFSPKEVVILDQAESPLYDVHNELKSRSNSKCLKVVIGDVSNKTRMTNVFESYRPDIVYHAAAYKHVPLMEDNPSEAILTNVLGTKILAELADQFAVKKFVMISTDKAVNPTNVMGASKRIAEIFCQALNKKSNVQFVTTRFGNVLGSSGSVIPLFRRQIEAGGPLTVTHAEVTRFFMTIPEACQLVLEAGSMGEGGEIFVFDMGESVKIIDLAKKMISLSGLKLDEDISIKITGLRPGEKLYEELLTSEEGSLPTHHAQIMIGKVQEYDFNEVTPEIEQLIGDFNSQDNAKIVAKMKTIVPEYKSNNSEFSVLD
ncbi:MAG: FlaA1/EpsC-like NDP-sugar epimerase [Parvicellaceae bacterium]|jgi:FlaA1/EpsC-like NDP-sugar epimerase